MDYPKSVPGSGLENGKFVDEDPIAGKPGSLTPASWGNSVTQEILNTITAAGLTPDEEQTDQLAQAIRQLAKPDPLQQIGAEAAPAGFHHVLEADVDAVGLGGADVADRVEQPDDFAVGITREARAQRRRDPAAD